MELVSIVMNDSIEDSGAQELQNQKLAEDEDRIM